MPSPDLLPPGRALSDRPAPALEHVVTRAVRRRRVQVGVAGALSAAAAVSAVLLLAPGAAPGSLKVVTPAQGISPTPQPTGAATPTTLSGGFPAKIKHAPGNPGSPTTSATATATSTAAADGGPQTATAPEGPAIIGPPHRVISYDATRGCNGSGPTPATGWCSYYDGATSGTAGHRVTLATAVCRLPGQGSGTLTSDDGREADFDVGVRAYPASWTWSHGQRFASGATSLTVAESTCVEWYVMWSVVDDAGRPLHPGTYYLDAMPDAGPPDANASAAASKPVTFTVQ